MSRSVVAVIEPFRETVQDYTSAVIGEEVFRVKFRFTPGYPATWSDPGEGPEIEFIHADIETWRKGERVWVPADGPDEDWCEQWLRDNYDAAVEAGHREMADRSDRAAEARMEEERRR